MSTVEELDLTTAEQTPTAPLAWLTRGEKVLANRRPALERFDRYYSGEHPLVYSSRKFKEAFGDILKHLTDNWCELVVDAAEERIDVEGFRVTATDPTGDEAAWRIWQRNGLDAGSQLLHLDALVYGACPVLVWQDQQDQSTGRARITVESPLEVAVTVAGDDRHRRLAAVKVWTDDAGAERGTVYLPDALHRFTKPTRGRGRGRWQPLEVDAEVRNPLGVVPVIPFLNRPRTRSQRDALGRSELATTIPLQDAVNKLLSDLLVASEFAGFRQRWATGLELLVDPETNQPIDSVKMAVNRLLISENPETRFGDFQVTDLGNYVRAIETVVQHIASQTRTPPHYFYLSGQFPSGESIRSAEAGLVAKVKRKLRHFGEGWEEVLRLAMVVEDIPATADDPDRVAMETIWRDPETRTESEHTDALLKLKALGVPDQMLWERAGLSSTEITRALAMRQTQAIDSAIAGTIADTSSLPPTVAGLTP